MVVVEVVERVEELTSSASVSVSAPSSDAVAEEGKRMGLMKRSKMTTIHREIQKQPKSIVSEYMNKLMGSPSSLVVAKSIQAKVLASPRRPNSTASIFPILSTMMSTHVLALVSFITGAKMYDIPHTVKRRMLTAMEGTMGLPHCWVTGDSSSAPRMHLIDATARYTMEGRMLGKDLKSLITATLSSGSSSCDHMEASLQRIGPQLIETYTPKPIKNQPKCVVCSSSLLAKM
mmetsp:Transcript_12271/g.25011  ORF Transcript_12271/g.25011 Transcript_12271/m.25011 type:complete len:232 (-) Transcript_12271:129-824(-)